MYTAESVTGSWCVGYGCWSGPPDFLPRHFVFSQMARPARGLHQPISELLNRTQRRTKTTSHRSSDLTTLSTGKFMQVVGTPIIQQHYCWRWFPLVIHDISAPLSSPHSELGTVGINPSVLALRRFGPKVLVSASHANNFFCILLHPRPFPSYLMFSFVRYAWFPVQGLRDGPDQKTQDTC